LNERGEEDEAEERRIVAEIERRLGELDFVFYRLIFG